MSLEGFIRSLVSVGLKIVIVLTFAGMIGLPTTSLLAVFGAAGLAVGLANLSYLQKSIQSQS